MTASHRMLAATTRLRAESGLSSRNPSSGRRLHRVHAEEVGDAEVAGRGRPVDERQAGAAVGRADGVGVVGDDQPPSKLASRKIATPSRMPQM